MVYSASSFISALSSPLETGEVRTQSGAPPPWVTQCSLGRGLPAAATYGTTARGVERTGLRAHSLAGHVGPLLGAPLGTCGRCSPEGLLLRQPSGSHPALHLGVGLVTAAPWLGREGSCQAQSSSHHSPLVLSVTREWVLWSFWVSCVTWAPQPSCPHRSSQLPTGCLALYLLVPYRDHVRSLPKVCGLF